MHVKRWQQERSFSADKFQKVNLFESERMFCDIYCFGPGQEQALHSHDENDKIYCVLEGRGTFTVGGESREHGRRLGRCSARRARTTAW